jgi:hypothetical protein
MFLDGRVGRPTRTTRRRDGAEPWRGTKPMEGEDLRSPATAAALDSLLTSTPARVEITDRIGSLREKVAARVEALRCVGPGAEQGLEVEGDGRTAVSAAARTRPNDAEAREARRRAAGCDSGDFFEGYEARREDAWSRGASHQATGGSPRELGSEPG